MEVTVTKQDTQAIRMASSCVISLDASGGYCEMICETPAMEPLTHQRRHRINCEIVVCGNHKLRAGWRFCNVALLYYSTISEQRTILNTIRTGDRVRFEFYPDGHSNDYTRSAQLHADILRMHLFRKGTFVGMHVFDSAITPDNSARMCQGIILPMSNPQIAVMG